MQFKAALSLMNLFSETEWCWLYFFNTHRLTAQRTHIFKAMGKVKLTKDLKQ